MDVRDALLEAAIKVFAEVGMRGATTRRIAQAADVNEVTLFRHFKTKEDLLHAALETFARQTLTRTLPADPVAPARGTARLVPGAPPRALQTPRVHPQGHGRVRRAPRALRLRHAGRHPDRPGTHRLLRPSQTPGPGAGDWDERAATNMLMGALFSDAMGRDTMPERYPHRMSDVDRRYVDLLLRAIGASDATPTTRRAARPKTAARRTPARGRTA